MKRVLVTGAKGFIGRNLCIRLIGLGDVEVYPYDIDNREAELREWLSLSDVVFHLAGVNRPQNVEEYEKGNTECTRHVCGLLRELGRTPKIVMTSSIQAVQDNPYGLSKRRAEESLQEFSRQTGAAVSIYRLKNVFGKWCKPKYNSVTATFCYNIAHDLPISISDPAREIELVYIDDIIERFLEELSEFHMPETHFAPDTIPSISITLGELAGRVQLYHDMKSNLIVPDFSERFNRCLYATYLSYVEPETLEYGLEVKKDSRGSLAEFIRSRHFGQVFVSRTHPGITRGNHYHNTKTEKFLVIAGAALIRMRHIERIDMVEYRVCGEDYRVIDIPPGHTHSIKNVGDGEMITLFWASEIFDPDRPDTYYLEVAPASRSIGQKI